MEALGSWEVLFSLGDARMVTGDVTAWTALMLAKCKGFGHSPWKAEDGERPTKCRKVSGAKRAWSPATRV